MNTILDDQLAFDALGRQCRRAILLLEDIEDEVLKRQGLMNKAQSDVHLAHIAALQDQMNRLVALVDSY